ncbi:hypothetical protein [Microvirga sp. VF16]|uniref:hypothetical protein n=1 Tax=Microvirga sp. VF16 TaxID=2807101 RepID=UPI00193D9180|nr:hypothetical protein [Microvirga sp. VF16]QRM33255.1 hypothetical protein JO965_28725 [Microvirga sp. VF16]
MASCLLTDERQLLFGIHSDGDGLIRHDTLDPKELELALARRGARNRACWSSLRCAA